MSLRPSERGQSIIEMIVVLTLIGILAAIIMPSGSALPEMRLRAAAERLASDLRYAQSLARQEGGRVGCLFATSGSKGYTIVRTSALTPVSDPLQPAVPLRVELARSRDFKDVTLTWSMSDNGLFFDVMGGPRRLDYLEWTDPGSVILRLGTRAATVTIQPVTGDVSVEASS